MMGRRARWAGLPLAAFLVLLISREFPSAVDYEKKKKRIRVLAVSIVILVFAISSLSLALTSSHLIYAQSNQTNPKFDAAVDLSNSKVNATDPDIWSDANHVYVAWSEGRNGTMFRASSDYGSTWYPPLSSPALTISSPGGTTQYPLMSANGSNVYVTWAQTVGTTGLQVFEATSTNYGTSFSPAVQLTSGSPSGGFITPVIASWGNLVAVAFVTNQTTYVTVSQDAGSNNSWSQPKLLFDTLEPQIAIWENHIYGVAGSVRLSGPVSFAVSNDSGASWQVNQVGYYNSSGSESWIWTYGSNVYAAWETKGDNSSVYVLVSNDYGEIWNVQLLSGTLSDSWAPMVWAYGNSAWIALESHPGGRLAQIYVYTTKNAGLTWSPTVSLSGALGSNSTTGYPFTVWSSDGQNVFIGWPEQVNPGYWRMMVSYSGDGGATWTPPPGMNASQNLNGEASNEDDVATGAISASGPDCFATWEYLNGSSPDQVYFAMVQMPTTTSLSSSSDSSGSLSSQASESGSSSTAQSISTTSSVAKPSTSNQASPPVPSILVLVGIATFFVGMGSLVFFMRRKT